LPGDAVGLTVIIPVRNMARTLPDQLAALSSQPPELLHEVIVVDHGSTDGSADVARSFAQRFDDLRIASAPGPHGSGGVRNAGVAGATGDRLAFLDADDAVGEGWARAMVDALSSHALVAGVPELARLNPAHTYQQPRWTQPPVFAGFLPSAIGCAFGIRRDLFDRVGGFDADLTSGQDLEICWRAQLFGEPLHFAANAIVHRRVPHHAWAALLRQHRYNAGLVRLHELFRPHGMTGRPARDVGYDAALLMLRLSQLGTRAARYRWAQDLGRHTGRIGGSIAHRHLYL
jgi:GT2 family glycosyltransferase